MKTPITLERTLTAKGWHIAGEVAGAVKRQWEPALLKLAQLRGALTPEIVSAELLGGRMPVARRLLAICTRLGLLVHEERTWRLTADGQVGAQSGDILIPQRGTWTVWALEDVFLPGRIVAVLPWSDEPSAYAEQSTRGERRTEKLPQWLTARKGKSCRPLTGKWPLVRIDDFGREERGEPLPREAKLRLTLTIRTNGVELRVKGALDEMPVDAELPAPQVTHADVWRSLLRQANLLDRWDSYRSALLVSFGDTTEPERSSMLRTQRFAEPTLDGLGKFNPAAVGGVPLFPGSREDASALGEWRLIQSIRDYMVGDSFERAYREAIAPFADIAPPCPDREQLARRLRGRDRPPPAFWRLQAPVDWNLVERRER